MNRDYIDSSLERISSENLETALSYKKPKIRFLTVAAAAALALTIGVGGVVLAKSGTDRVRTDDPDINLKGTDTSVISDGGEIVTGGEEGGALISNAEITYTGQAIPAAKIEELITREKNNIAQYVRSENKGMEGDICIALEGYNYLQTRDNTVALDFVTLPVFTGDRIIGEAVVYSVNGELTYSVSAGGTSWEKRSEAFAASPDGRVCFVYIGSLREAMIAPDDTVFALREGTDDPLAGIPKLFERYSDEHNTYSFRAMKESGRYVTADR